MERLTSAASTWQTIEICDVIIDLSKTPSTSIKAQIDAVGAFLCTDDSLSLQDPGFPDKPFFSCGCDMNGKYAGQLFNVDFAWLFKVLPERDYELNTVWLVATILLFCERSSCKKFVELEALHVFGTLNELCEKNGARGPRICHSCGKTDNPLVDWHGTSTEDLKALGHKKMQACGRCHRVHYCSSRCQRADWEAHRDVCAAPLVEENEEGIVT